MSASHSCRHIQQTTVCSSRVSSIRAPRLGGLPRHTQLLSSSPCAHRPLTTQASSSSRSRTRTAASKHQDPGQASTRAKRYAGDSVAATTTRMVNNIWQNYFQAHTQQQHAQEAAAEADETAAAAAGQPGAAAAAESAKVEAAEAAEDAVAEAAVLGRTSSSSSRQGGAVAVAALQDTAAVAAAAEDMQQQAVREEQVDGLPNLVGVASELAQASPTAGAGSSNGSSSSSSLDSVGSVASSSSVASTSSTADSSSSRRRRRVPLSKPRQPPRTEAPAAAAAYAGPSRAVPAQAKAPSLLAAGTQVASQEVTWLGPPTGQQQSWALYSGAAVGGLQVVLGSVVLLGQGPGTQPGLVQCMWQDDAGRKRAQVRLLLPGERTVLGDAAADAELFVTDTYHTVELGSVAGVLAAQRLARDGSHTSRLAEFEEDEARRARNAAAAAAGTPLEFIYRHLYLPHQGMFASLPHDLQLGTFQEPVAPPVAAAAAGPDGFIKDGVEYRVGDFLFVDPRMFRRLVTSSSSSSSSSPTNSSSLDSMDGTDSSSSSSSSSTTTNLCLSRMGRHKGSMEDMSAWVVARVAAVQHPPEAAAAAAAAAAKAGQPVGTRVLLQRFFRPEDISRDLAYRSDYHDLYAPPASSSSSSSSREGEVTPEWERWMDVTHIIHKCAAAGSGQPTGPDGLHCFTIKGTYDPLTQTLSDPPPAFQEAAAAAAGGSSTAAAAAAGPALRPLRSLDIFAGCGGLSEGMHQAGVADTRWAIEYEVPAADAFKLNNPQAAVYASDCNVILAAAMHKACLLEDCLASEQAQTGAAGLSKEQVSQLPLPGEVEFMMGGPPCQGYSGMNRHNTSAWSMQQNSMVLSYLSFCDFYRPRYFLLENVRNFVAHNNGLTFRLVLRTLLDMGYQVRYGVLNAGHYGAPQSRLRTFIWAAAPQEKLPDWPQPQHTFRTEMLRVHPSGVPYCAINVDLPPGAPLRTVTVRDAIGDLPAIENGDMNEVMEYGQPPESAFQAKVRGGSGQLLDHMCKKMDDINLTRCKYIPKHPPASDWRALLDVVRQDPSLEIHAPSGQPLVPQCLVNTAARHGGWAGLYGRLPLDGHFPTSVTDPRPMGKVGQVFHPTQDRIISVREHARSQGFPDHYQFTGSIMWRHKQVGNAVPPPLAAALGSQLKAALQATAEQAA